MQIIAKRLAALRHLWSPLILASLGIVGISLGLAYFVIAFYHTVSLPGFFYYLTLQFLDRWLRGWLLLLVGAILLAAGIWKLSGVAVIPLDATLVKGSHGRIPEPADYPLFITSSPSNQLPATIGATHVHDQLKRQLQC